MKIAIIGTGYVGLVTGACLAYKGHQVTCVDKREGIVATINNMESPIYEPGLEGILQQVVSSGSLKATGDTKAAVEEAAVTIIAVGTPLGEGGIDLGQVKQAAQEIGAALKGKEEYHVVCVKSTVVPTTTDTVVKGILEQFSGKQSGEFGLAMNPEFLREGNAVADFMLPDRIVIGADDASSLEVMKRVYAGFEVPMVATNLRTAEMIKYTANALLATLISYANEIAGFCEATGDVDVQDVFAAVVLDRRLTPRIGEEIICPEVLSYLQAGCGYGGSCFPKDLQALEAYAREKGCNPRLVSATIATNAEQAERIVQRLEGALGSLEGKKTTVLGLAFKPGTDDIRDSPALKIIRGLLAKGAKVSATDPFALERAKALGLQGVTYTEDYEAALRRAEAVLLVTPWRQYVEIPAEKYVLLMAHPLVVDCRRALDRGRLEGAGAIYIGVGLT